eukprot:482383-Pelagomonas_calceolata.AAC.3
MYLQGDLPAQGRGAKASFKDVLVSSMCVCSEGLIGSADKASFEDVLGSTRANSGNNTGA